MFGWIKKSNGATPSKPTSDGEPVIAALLLQGEHFPLDQVKQELTKTMICGQAPQSIAIQKGILMSRLGDEILAFAPMPARYPWSDLKGPCATSWMWPKQTPATTLESHQRHVLVTLIGGHGAPIARRMCITHAVALGARQQGTMGVYWPEATLVHYPPIFVEMAQSAINHNAPPLYLWVDFRVLRNPDGTCALFTTGMKPLGQMEFEIPRIAMQPGELREWAMNIAFYLLENGDKVKDGHTMGMSAKQRIRVHYLPSLFGPRGTVLQLQC